MGRNARDAARGVELPERYEVTRLIGVGGMASIWAAEDRLLRRSVAIKVLAEQFAEQPQFVERFEREARTAASLSGHPHVVTIYDVGEHAGRPFIVMEHLSGGTLRRPHELRAAARGPTCCAGWARPPSALDFAHAQGRRTPRREAAQPAVRRARPAGGRRLRHRARRVRGAAHRQRRAARHRRLHLAGADARRARDPRQRPLCVRGRRLRGAHRRPAVRHRHADRDRDAAHPDGPAARERALAGSAAGGRRRAAARPGPRSRRALADRATRVRGGARARAAGRAAPPVPPRRAAAAPTGCEPHSDVRAPGPIVRPYRVRRPPVAAAAARPRGRRGRPDRRAHAPERRRRRRRRLR